jgi:penicillin-binding protein 2
MAVVIEHGTFGAAAAAPIAKDVMTFLFDPDSAVKSLHALEAQWGGNAIERMARRYGGYEIARPGIT